MANIEGESNAKSKCNKGLGKSINVRFVKDRYTRKKKKIMIEKIDVVYVLKQEIAAVDNWDLLLAEYETNDKC